MIKASEARELAKNNISDETELELLAAEKSIKQAVAKGEGKCWCYTYLHEQAISQLRMLGCKVNNCSDQRDGTIFEIKWA
jgi:hypothetical protein